MALTTTLAALPAASSAVPCAGLEPGVPRRAALSFVPGIEGACNARIRPPERKTVSVPSERDRNRPAASDLDRGHLSPADAAASLSLHRDTVIRAIKAWHLYAIKAGRQWRIPHYALAGWLERGGQAGNAASLAECKRRQHVLQG